MKPNWTARLAWAILLLLAGMALAIWALGHWQAGARFFGVSPMVEPQPLVAAPAAPAPNVAVAAPTPPADLARIEQRLAAVENATRRAEGSAGRADGLLVAFAARRAIERGEALGYLEPLLISRFGQGRQAAVTTVITAGRAPDTIDRLTSDYVALGNLLKGPAPDEGFWTGVKREMGSLVSIRREGQPNPRPVARYDRALAVLRGGKVGDALAETMWLPGASRAEVRPWIERARRRVAVEQALDQLESQALVGATQAG